MSNIQTYLQQILDAVYGEEVRGSIHDAIATMNSDLESAIRDDLNPLAFKGNLGESGGTNNNLNSLVTTDQRGIWRLLGSRTYTNVPSDFVNSKQAYLIIYAFGTSGQTANVIKQEIHYFSDSGSNANAGWSRVYLSGEWQEWHKNVDSTLSLEGGAADAKATGEKISHLNSALHREKIQSMHYMEENSGCYFADVATGYGRIITSTGAVDDSLPLRGIYTSLIDGTDIQKLVNDSGGVGGVRTYTYSSDGTFESYKTNGNVREVVISDATKKYRFFIYPMATGGNSDSTYETLDSILDGIYFISNTRIPQSYTVAKDGTGHFSSIQDAINIASDGDTITIKAGFYTETIVNTKQIHFIGQNKHSTIIANSTGEYATPPIWTCQGIWENLTIRAIDAGNSPTLDRMGFAVHLDMKWSQNDRRICVFKNCIILSDWSDAIGSGIEKNCIIELDNVICKSEQGAGLKIHSTAGNNGYNSNLYVKNCIFESKASGQHGLMIHTAGAQASEVNTISLHINNSAMTDYVHYTAPIIYDPMNYGNSVAELNQL